MSLQLSGSLPNWVRGAAGFSATLLVTGAAGPLRFSNDVASMFWPGVPVGFFGQLGFDHTGLTLNTATGEISGTPTGLPGNYFFAFSVNDGIDNAYLSSGITIYAAGAPLAIVSAFSGSGAIGLPWGPGQYVASGGTPPYTWAISVGSLPPGLSLDAATGIVSGIPTGPAGVSSYTIRVTDTAAATVSLGDSIDVGVTFGGFWPQLYFFGFAKAPPAPAPKAYFNGSAEQLLCDREYPWIDPPPGSSPRSLRRSIVAPAVGVMTEIFSYQVPENFYLVIDRMMHRYEGTGYVEGSGSIIWSMDVNRPIGGPQLTGRPIGQFITSAGSLTRPVPVGPFQIAGGDVFRYKVVVTDAAVGVGAPNMIHAAALGWLYSKARL